MISEFKKRDINKENKSVEKDGLKSQMNDKRKS